MFNILLSQWGGKVLPYKRGLYGKKSVIYMNFIFSVINFLRRCIPHQYRIFTHKKMRQFLNLLSFSVTAQAVRSRPVDEKWPVDEKIAHTNPGFNLKTALHHYFSPRQRNRELPPHVMKYSLKPFVFPSSGGCLSGKILNRHRQWGIINSLLKLGLNFSV